MFSRIPWFCGRKDPVPVKQPDQEELVDQELMFHLRCLVDDNLRRGMSFDAAWDNAEKRFGPLRRHADGCRRVVRRRRWVWLALPAAVVIIPVVLSALYFRRVEAMLQVELAKARAQRAAVAAANGVRNPPAPREYFDLAGSIVSRRGETIARGTVLAILKTWPGGRYRQQAFATQTDAEGRFSFARLIPSEGQYAFHLAAYKDGFALTSTYHLVEASDQPHSAPESVRLELDDAVTLTLFVEDGAGHRVANARVIPSARQAAKDTPLHFVYFQAAEPIQAVADQEGRVDLGCFQPGDQAQVYIQVPGRDWEQRSFRVPKVGNSVVVIGSEAAASSESSGDDDQGDSS